MIAPLKVAATVTLCFRDILSALVINLVSTSRSQFGNSTRARMENRTVSIL